MKYGAGKLLDGQDTSPSGFCMLEASLAKSLFAEMPMELVRHSPTWVCLVLDVSRKLSGHHRLLLHLIEAASDFINRHDIFNRNMLVDGPQNAVSAANEPTDNRVRGRNRKAETCRSEHGHSGPKGDSEDEARRARKLVGHQPATREVGNKPIRDVERRDCANHGGNGRQAQRRIVVRFSASPRSLRSL